MPNDETFQQVARKFALLTGLNERAPLAHWDAALKKLCADREKAILAARTPELRRRAELLLDQARNAGRLVAQKILIEKLRQHVNEKSRRAYEGILAKTENRALLPAPGETTHEDWLRLQDLAEKAFSVVATPAPGKVGAGRFTLVKALGRGGMGEVWLARDERLHEEVALKLLAPEIRGDAVALDDLRRETSRSHGLTHPNIVRIYDLHEDADGMAFITMEYVDGPTLAALWLQQPQRVLQWDFLRPLLEQLCAALDYAHSEKIIHRDLKPANVMISSHGRLKLADFGIAAVANDSKSRVSVKHPTSGTPPYMSPQQLAGKRPQATDDIYALGATFYELLTSKPPFYRGDLTHQILYEAPEPINERLASLEIHNEIPPNVCALIMDCLAKEPEQRPQSVAEIRSRLQAPVQVPATEPAPWVEVQQPVVEEPAPEPSPPFAEPAAEPKPGKSRRKPMLFAMIAVIVCALAAGWYWKVQADAARVAALKRHAAEAEAARLAKEKQKVAEAETARRAEAARQAEAARLAEAHRLAQLEKQAAERKRILQGNDPGALKTLAVAGDADAAVKLGHFYHSGNGVTRDYAQAVKWYRQAADAGNSDAQASLGTMYDNGLGVTKDYTQAINWYRKAAEAGNPDGQLWLGHMCENGLGVRQNYTEAIKWYRKAAEAGNSEAQLRLGGIYSNGLGVEKDYTEAIKWYRKAAEAGISIGQNYLGFVYENGLGVVKDSAQAIKWYGKAAEAGNPDGQQNLARLLAEQKRQADEAEAARLADAKKQAQLEARAAERQKILDSNDPEALRTLAAQGDTDAAVNLGLIFENGRGVNQNYGEARKWYAQAASGGNPRGQIYVGLMYKNGLGIDKDYTEAFVWFRRAAAQGNSDGQVLLGGMFQNGLGINQDYTQAVMQYRKASDAGNPDGQDHLGYMYLYGLGVAKNYTEAVKCFRKAADQGNSSGQNNLGWMCEHGWGVDQDYTEAVKWYRKAAEAGNSLGQTNLERILGARASP